MRRLRALLGGESGTMGAGALAGGTLTCLALAFLVGVLMPITDSANRDAALGEPRSYDGVALMGRTLYIREGCFSCHTQAVRDTFADTQLDRQPSQAGHYLNEAPNLIGSIRLGPDLSCVADRQDDANWYVRHLRNPQSVREHSTMPSYQYLSTSELQALAAYLLRLSCTEV